MSDDRTPAAANFQKELPKGLPETIAAFNAGCDAKNREVAADVASRIVDRFSDAYRANEGDWKPPVSEQVLTIARLAGRLGALYAQLAGSGKVEWAHARFGLRDAQAECQTVFRSAAVGKHCKSVDLETP